MSAIPSLSHGPQSAGHDWFERHLPELTSRCRAFLRRVPVHTREEAQAEILASIFQYVLRADRRGKLHALTPFTLVSFFGRGVCQGRRMTGTSTTDALDVVPERCLTLKRVSWQSWIIAAVGWIRQTSCKADVSPSPVNSTVSPALTFNRFIPDSHPDLGREQQRAMTQAGSVTLDDYFPIFSLTVLMNSSESNSLRTYALMMSVISTSR